MTKDEALNHALQLVSNLRTHSWTVADTQFVITAIKQALANDALEKKAENARELGLMPYDGGDYEPVAWMCADESLINKGYARFSHVCMGDWKIPVYTTKPQRTWVGLTDDEIDDLSRTMVKGNKSVNWLCQAVEAKLKGKNT